MAVVELTRPAPTRNLADMRKPGMVAALVATMTISSGARAWDDFGHMEVASVAFKRLKPKARTRVAQLLKLNPRYANWIVGARKSDQPRIAFLRAATWAD